MGEKEWYFFSLRDRKYPTGVRTNRATNTGYWKTTGKDKEIYNSATSELVGMKKTLVFYKGRAPRGEKSNWVMHEYRMHTKSAYRTSKQDEWVVCRVFQKSGAGKKYPSNHSRAVNPFSYNLEIVPQNPMQPQMLTPDNFHIPGRSYITPAEFQEFNKVFSGAASSSTINLPIQHQPNYATGGCFTISSLNLNLGGGAAPAQPHMQPTLPGMSQQDVTSAMLIGAAAIGGDQGGGFGGDRFVGMDQSGEFESYWPSY